MARKPTTATARALGEEVAAHFDQRFESSVEGPHNMGPYTVWRVWTEEIDPEDEEEVIEYHAHHVVDDDGKRIYFEDFAPFALWLSKELDLDRYAVLQQGEVKLGVAVIVILVALGLLIYLIVWAPGQSSVVNYILTAVVGGACGAVITRKIKT